MVNFRLKTKEESRVIHKIAALASKTARDVGVDYPTMDAAMDITACHCNGMPLDLEALLHADEFDFAHDVLGIRRHIDRETGKLGGCFVPRYAQR